MKKYTNYFRLIILLSILASFSVGLVFDLVTYTYLPHGKSYSTAELVQNPKKTTTLLLAKFAFASSIKTKSANFEFNLKKNSSIVNSFSVIVPIGPSNFYSGYNGFSVADIPLTPGDYSISEVPKKGWDNFYANCVMNESIDPIGLNFTVAEGDGVYCYFDNAQENVNPPVLSAISPAEVPAGTKSVIITLTGSNFSEGSMAIIFDSRDVNNDIPLTSARISDTEMKANIVFNQLEKPRWLAIAVVNPTPGGVSNIKLFQVK